MTNPDEAKRPRQILIAISVLIVLAGTFFLGGALEKTNHQNDHNEEEVVAVDNHANEPAQKYQVTDGEKTPTLLVSLKKDSKAGYNVKLTTTDFTFTPESVGTGTSSANEGHAHIYVNDKKVGRMYGTTYHLPELKQGDRVVVNLTTNNHEDIQDGDIVIATERVAE